MSEYKLYYPNGILNLECYMVGDDRHGPFKSYYSTGQIFKKGTYFNNKLDGECVYYNAFGYVEKVITYDNGKKSKQ